MSVDQIAAMIFILCNLSSKTLTHNQKDQCIDHFNNCTIKYGKHDQVDQKLFDECTEQAKEKSKTWEP